MDARDADRGHRVGVRDLPRVPGRSCAPARHGAQLHRATSGTARAAALRDGRRRLRARRDARRDRAHVRARGARRIGAGAAGFSTSFSYTHRGVDGKPVPSRFADRDEVEALFRRRRRAPARACVLITPGEQCTYADVYERQPRIGRPFTYPLFALAGRQAPRPQLALHEQRLAPGADGLAAGHAAPAHDAVHDGRPVQPQRRHGVRRADAAATATARIAAYADPAWRARAAADLEQVADEAAVGDVRGLRVGAVPRARGPAGDELATRARLQPARRDVRARARRGPRPPASAIYIANDDADARRATCSTHEQRRARALRRRRPRRPALRRAARDRPARDAGCASAR